MEETGMEWIGLEWDPRDLVLNFKTCYLEVSYAINVLLLSLIMDSNAYEG
jgi:hypothetical protein